MLIERAHDILTLAADEDKEGFPRASTTCKVSRN